MARTTKTLTVSLPPQLFEEIEKLANEERKTKSELFREMIRVYEDYLDERRWLRLRKLGRETAKRLNITSEKDIERIVREARGIRS